MMHADKYKPGYFPVPPQYNTWVQKDHLEKPPIWCSVDMRDGNQSLTVPMSLSEKLTFFKVLVDIGFKEIEVGFPAASETEYEFLRTLIEKNLIPADVTIQVLTPCRPHIIEKTFEACKGAKNIIIHFYNSLSRVQREQVFQMPEEEIKKIAVEGAKYIKKTASLYGGNFRFEYSPESFTGTEPEYALEVCNAVLDILEPASENPVIINLPVTVELSMPHVYAAQVEYMHTHLKYRENVILSVHPHNDRGTGVADAELALLAGAQRIEGTLFGNGERTGNADIITLAMNLYSHGIDPCLDFSDMPRLVENYKKCTRMQVYSRAPYAGDFVFAAFSGSHQDAIAKGLRYREEHALKHWCVPYMPIDPHDINRTYNMDVIRFNSQSGKGGIGYLLEETYGYVLPNGMREHLSYLCKDIADREHRELKAPEVLSIFKETYLMLSSPLSVSDMHFHRKDNTVELTITFLENGRETTIKSNGNGSLDAISNALKSYKKTEYLLEVYTEHSMQEKGSGSMAVSYIGIKGKDNKMYWGAGMDTDIIHASTTALLHAFQNMEA